MNNTPAALQFTEAELLGKVAAVDTSRVSIDVSNSVLLTRIGIGNLIAVRGSTEREYLIAVTERVTRSMRDELAAELPEQREIYRNSFFLHKKKKAVPRLKYPAKLPILIYSIYLFA